MARVVVRGPDGRKLTLDLPSQRVLLLGRKPDPQTAQIGVEVEGWPVESVALETTTTVSANHAVVWSQEDGVCVRDIGSTNGTWLFLPHGRTVRVGGPEADLQLAQSAAGEGATDEPPLPQWSGARDYARGMARSIEQWLDGHGVEVRVHLIADPTKKDPPQWLLPLATGEALDLETRDTITVKTAGLMDQLLRWTERQNCTYAIEEETRGEGLILASRAIRAAHREVVDIAKRGAQTLLLMGPTGAGKEKFAEVFHRNSGRAGPLVAVNCSDLNKQLLRAELFGAERGSYTDSKMRMIGAVERAQGGTLFLDEIGDMDIEVQPMLLRFLDRGEYQIVGQLGRAQHADVRIVAATNRDLREAVNARAFRTDLWWRLSAHVIEIPPLRSRWEDISAYLDTVRMEDGRSTLRDALSPEALELLRTHAWEGNFRELRNVTDRLACGGHRRPIDAATCRRALDLGRDPEPSPSAAPVDSSPADWTALVWRAVQAFKEDHKQLEPSSWDDLKEWHEKYLKPLLFFHLSGAAGHPAPVGDEAVTSLAYKCAPRMKADRATAFKQLSRYFVRFRT